MAKIPESIKKLKTERPYFNYQKARLTDRKYVAWIDLMGSASILSRSDVMASIFIGKLHSCALISAEKTKFSGNIYPFVDGIYATSLDRANIQCFIKCVFRLMALNFIFEEQTEHRFLLRASISFGQIIEAENISGCANIFDKYREYTRGVLFGTPLARAYSSEVNAAPFGVWIEDTARHFAPPSGKTIRRTFWEWWSYPSNIQEVDNHCDQIEHILSEELSKYFDWCARNHHRILYEREAIDRHKDLASQYFPSWPSK